VSEMVRTRQSVITDGEYRYRRSEMMRREIVRRRQRKRREREPRHTGEGRLDASGDGG